MKYWVIYLLSIVILNSCKVQKPNKGDFYFPLNSIYEKDKLDTFENESYSEHLKSLQEPVLYNLKDNIQIFRYTNIGTWDQPFTYRIEIKDTVVSITYKCTNGQGGYEVGDLMVNETKSIETKDLNSLESKISEINFWNSPSVIDDGGKDGSVWILEGYENGKYHFIKRWSPDYNGDSNFVAVCRYFEELYNKK